MAVLKHIKSFQGNGRITLLQALAAFVFGNNPAKEYDSTKVYNAKDTIIYRNLSTGQLEVLKCTTDGTTGTFDISKWTTASVSDMVAGKTSNLNTTIISATQPTDESNVVWFKEVNSREVTLP